MMNYKCWFDSRLNKHRIATSYSLVFLRVSTNLLTCYLVFRIFPSNWEGYRFDEHHLELHVPQLGFQNSAENLTKTEKKWLSQQALVVVYVGSQCRLFHHWIRPVCDVHIRSILNREQSIEKKDKNEWVQNECELLTRVFPSICQIQTRWRYAYVQNTPSF